MCRSDRAITKAVPELEKMYPKAVRMSLSCHVADAPDSALLSCPCFLFSGVGIGVVHAGYERRLAHHLGAHSTPSILGLINGRITFFHNAVVRENLRQFIESLLPGNLVEKVTRTSSFNSGSSLF